ncbi:MAG TPA: MIP/aquaporin family protein [Pirellulaceae bacterium]|nr:MIP/aquaporin family protein [Pirellulaceae bacterium]
MNVYFAEFLGTTLLVLMGNGVVANVVLSKTKGNGGGWIVITAGWAFAVYTAVLCVGEISGAHINPAVTIALAVTGQFDWQLVVGYIMAQLAGGILGGALVYCFYHSHYKVTDDPDLKLATFSTAPGIRSLPVNLFCEVLATFVLVYAVLQIGDPTIQLSGTEATPIGLGSVGAIRVALIVFAIGLSLGGTTGYAINPARDLGPRIAHAMLPIPGKGPSDWAYAPIPVAGPIIGAMLAALLYSVA